MALVEGRCAEGLAMNGAAEVLERLLDELDIKMGVHEPGDCPVADPTTGGCEVCDVLDKVIEAVMNAENRMERVRCGLPPVLT